MKCIYIIIIIYCIREKKNKISASKRYCSVESNVKLCCFLFICRIISEFEAFRKRALTKPEDTREMIDMLKFVEQAKTKDLVKLNSDIKVNTMHVWLEYN